MLYYPRLSSKTKKNNYFMNIFLIKPNFFVFKRSSFNFRPAVIDNEKKNPPPVIMFATVYLYYYYIFMIVIIVNV